MTDRELAACGRSRRTAPAIAINQAWRQGDLSLRLLAQHAGPQEQERSSHVLTVDIELLQYVVDALGEVRTDQRRLGSFGAPIHVGEANIATELA